jgi:hypothetical protein
MSNLTFAIDKATSDVHEGLAVGKIQRWYANRGQRVHARYNELNGLTEKRECDLIDTFGVRWEVKFDHLE